MELARPPHPGRRWLRTTATLVAVIPLCLIDSARAEQGVERDDDGRSPELLNYATPGDSVVDGRAAGGGDATAGDGTTDRGGDGVSKTLETPRPTEWAPSHGRQCHRYKGRRVCEGPRMAPLPHGEAAELAKTLGLGTRRAASVLQRQAPLPEWLAAIGGEESDGDAPLYWPVDEGQLWRGYGPVRHRGRRRFHRGVDIGAPAGSLIRSVRRGLVAYSDNGIDGYGNLMLIIHADTTVAWYAHCQASYVFAGQVVLRGQVIGEVGATGLAYGTHLHFEMRREGHPFNPMPLFESPPTSSHADH